MAQEAKFCSACGEPVPVPNPPFCSQCGTRLSRQTDTPSDETPIVSEPPIVETPISSRQRPTSSQQRNTPTSSGRGHTQGRPSNDTLNQLGFPQRRSPDTSTEEQVLNAMRRHRQEIGMGCLKWALIMLGIPILLISVCVGVVTN